MPEQANDIVGLVDCIVRPLVDFEDDLQISVTETEEGASLIEIRAHEDDIGKIIGRRGRVIKSIRTLARAAAMRKDELVEVEIIG